MFENILVWQFIATLWDLNTLARAGAGGGRGRLVKSSVLAIGHIQGRRRRRYREGGIERADADGMGGIQIAPSGTGRTDADDGARRRLKEQGTKLTLLSHLSFALFELCFPFQ